MWDKNQFFFNTYHKKIKMDNKILRLKAQLGLLTLPFIISGQTHVEAWGRCFVSKWLTQFLDNEKKT